MLRFKYGIVLLLLLILSSLLQCSFAHSLSLNNHLVDYESFISRIRTPSNVRFPITRREFVHHRQQAQHISVVPPLPPPPAEVHIRADPFRVAYFLNVSIGTPSDSSPPLSVVIDTGSGNLAVAGAQCHGCVGAHAYNASASHTAKIWQCRTDIECPCTSASQCICNTTTNQCSFGVRYVDGSGWTATPVSDVVRLAQYSAINTVAMIEYQSGAGTFYDDNDGTMGFAYGRNLTVTGSSWFIDWAREHSLAPVFSLCIGWKQGWLSVGRIDTSLITTPPIYTPIYQTGYYTVNLTSITVVAMRNTGSGAPITSVVPIYRDPLDTLGPLLDTGSTLMHFDPTTYNRLMAAINTMCTTHSFGWVGICDDSARYGFNNWTTSECITINATELRQWPILQFNFEKADDSRANTATDETEYTTVELSAFEYMNPIRASSKQVQHQSEAAAPSPSLPPPPSPSPSRYWCRGFDMTPMHANINIGDPLFRTVAVVHDIEQMRIGFAKPNRKVCF